MKKILATSIFLIAQSLLASIPDDGINKLITAVGALDINAAQELIQQGVHPNCQDSDGMRPLIKLVCQKNRWQRKKKQSPEECIEFLKEIFKMAELLMNNGAEIDGTDDTGATALKVAVLLGFYDLGKYLVERGADSNKKDLFGKSAADIAVQLKRSEFRDLFEKESS